MLALAGRGQLVQRRQVHSAQRCDVAVDAVNIPLHAGHAHVALLNRQCQRGHVGLGIDQQLLVLLKPQPRSLFFELKFGDALAQWVKFTLQAQTALVTGAQLGRQVIVLAAFGAQVGLAL